MSTAKASAMQSPSGLELEAPPLGAIDYFHVVNDRRMRSAGLPGNHCAFVAVLQGTVDLRRVRHRLEELIAGLPPLRWQLVRRLRGYAWRPGPPPGIDERLHDVVLDPAETLQQRLDRLVAERLDERRPWAVDVVRHHVDGAPRDAIVFRWFHPLCDSRGAERLVDLLGNEAPLPPADACFATSNRLLKKLDRDKRIELARTYARHVESLAEVPIMSPYGATSSRSRIGVQQAIRLRLTETETSSFDERARKLAKLNESAVMVHACSNVVDQLLAKRGYSPRRQLVPVPLALDPKNETRRMFGNNLTMMLYALDRGDLESPERAVLRLGEQQRELVRKKLDVAMLAALELAQPFPTRLTSYIMTRPLAGELASYVFSNPGAVRLQEFAGVAVDDAFPFPAVVASPGLQMIFSRFASRLSVLLVAPDGLIARPELCDMADRLRQRLLGE